MSDALRSIIAEMTGDTVFLREQTTLSNNIGQPTELLVSYLMNKKIHLALVPHSFGGFGFDLQEEFQLILAASKISGTLGWIVFQLCGNLGRVFSFFPDSVIRGLLNEESMCPIICYHDNPQPGVIEERDGVDLLSGTWPAGSLSRVATHFCAPYREAGTRVPSCVVVRKDKVTIGDSRPEKGLFGASTCSYRLDDIAVASPENLVAAVKCNNEKFLPWYSVARSPIKHAAFAVGIGYHAIALIESIQHTDIDTSMLDECRGLIESSRLYFVKKIFNYQECVRQKSSLVSLDQIKGQIFCQIRLLQLFILDLVLAHDLICSSREVEVAGMLRQCLADIHVMSKHIAVRPSPEEVSAYLDINPHRMKLKERLHNGALAKY
jgi:hypothetical protein